MSRRRQRLKALCIGCTMLISSPSWAVIIEPGQGDLLINQGHGFKPVKKQINAKVGDSVMVRPGGTATVVYDDGCRVNVQPGAVATIAPVSPCASGSNAQDHDNYCTPGHEHDCYSTWQSYLMYTLLAGAGIFIGYEASRPGNPTPGPRNCLSAC